MKTKIMNFAKEVDARIEDVNSEYVKEAALNIVNNARGAVVCAFVTALCTGNAALETAELAVRSAKTGVKRGLIIGYLIYDSRPIVGITR